MSLKRDETKGLLVSLIFHVICCGLVGLIALTTLHGRAEEPVYDVALVGGEDAAPAPDATPPEPEPEPEIREEVIRPRSDDIVEKREVKPPVRKQENVPAPAAPPRHTAPGGTGSGTGTGSASGQGQGIGPASDAIQAPAVPPRVTRSQTPVYPEAARSQGVTGTAVVRFLVGKGGEVESLVLAKSSGSGTLDQSALRAAGAFRFRPGLDSYGRPIRCYAYQPFTFRL